MTSWRSVTRQDPCPICEKADWCRRSADGATVLCRRVDTGDGSERLDGAGAPFWVYHLDGRPHRPVDVPAEPETPRAAPDDLDRVYRALLGRLTLSSQHRADLHRRGLDDDAAQGYRTLPRRDRAALAADLVDRFGADLCATVPGLYLREDGDRRWWSLGGAAGLVIPCRDVDGRVVALKVRADDPGEDRPRYSYVSSTRHGGPGPGSPVHVPAACDGETATVRVTEGELKADVTTALSGTLTVSVAGVSTWRSVVPVLHQLGAETALVAFDADAETNPHVARALARCTAALQAEGFDVLLERWDAEQGKGIDDLLAAGGLPRQEEPTMLQEVPEEPGDVRHCKPGDHRCDDIGNGERFAELFGHKCRYCYAWETWLVYDGTRWAIDVADNARRAAHQVARSILREAFAAPEEQRSALAKFAAASGSRPRLEAMLREAQPYLGIDSTLLDADPLLLNCRNGVVDLRSGELKPHDPELLLSRRVEADYRPGADLEDTSEAAIWRQFLEDATGEDEELARFMQRAAGYTLTGNPNEEVVFFVYGDTGTGKSTFLEAVKERLADYADSLDFAALLRTRSGSDARPEIAKLQGKRMAVAVEASGQRTFEAELIKWITGGETISARALHQNPVSWRPQFTLWLAANHRPKVEHEDTAVWRRLRVIPLTHQVPRERVEAFAREHGKRDLKTVLREDCGDVVLAWLVRGCLDWRRDGLGSCAAVEAATGEYREAMNPIGDWLRLCCAVDRGRDWFTPTGDLWDSYIDWAEEAGERDTLSKKEFGKELKDRLGDNRRRMYDGRQQYGYDGIRLTKQAEFDFKGASFDPSTSKGARPGNADQERDRAPNPQGPLPPHPPSAERFSDSNGSWDDTAPGGNRGQRGQEGGKAQDDFDPFGDDE